MVEKVAPPDENYNTFIVISAPSGFRLRHQELEGSVSGRKEKLGPSDGLFVDTTDDLLSLRIPFLQSEVRYKIAYNVELPRSEFWFYRLALLGLVFFSIAVALSPFFSTPLVIYRSDVLRLVTQNRDDAAGVIMTLSLAAIGLLTNPLMRKNKLLFLLPFAITAVGLILL